MTITFEANLICDRCHKQCVTGEPYENVDTAVHSALDEAKANGWRRFDNKFCCPKCLDEGKRP